MSVSVTLPALAAPVDELWHAVLDLSDRLTTPWTVVGGQMVLLHALEHGRTPPQVSQDGDVIVDIRSDPTGLLGVVSELEVWGSNLKG